MAARSQAARSQAARSQAAADVSSAGTSGTGSTESEQVVGSDAAISGLAAGSDAAGSVAVAGNAVASDAAAGEFAMQPHVGAVGLGRPESVLNLQLRQDIIRSQANLLANSLAPPTHMTLEEFLRERPSDRRPRIPFEPLAGAELADQPSSGSPAERSIVAERSVAGAGLAVERGGQATAPAAERSVVPPRDARMAPGQPPGAMAKAAAPSRLTESPSQAQIVVIIRGKQRPELKSNEATKPPAPAQQPQD